MHENNAYMSLYNNLQNKNVVWESALFLQKNPVDVLCKVDYFAAHIVYLFLFY